MGYSVCYKILQAHLKEGKLEPGTEIGIVIDQTLTQDATGTMAYLQFEAMGIDRVKTEISVSYVDHNTLQMGFENADDHKYLQTMNAQFGIYYSKAGNGICHQVHLERFAKPGKTLLGSDSHTPTAGGMGMVAIGAGGLDVAVAMGGGLFYLTCPKVINIYLTGKLRPWVSAKDIILTVLQKLTTKGNVGYVIEYTGPGIATLSVPERATITNMGAELGVTTSLFPSDKVTREFLVAQGRENDFVELLPDKDAQYDKVIEIDLSTIEPMIACPHSPDNVVSVESIKGMKVDQVAIGSCTNSSYKDLVTVAKILKGKKIHPKVSCILAPGSKQVLHMLAKGGFLADIIESGVRVMESACGFCIGNGGAPISGGVSLRTNNRNFEGRSGTKDAKVYLVSPETAALSAIEGTLVNPLDMPAQSYPHIELPKTFIIDDSMIIPPFQSDEPIFRGPNIGQPPKTQPLPQTIQAVVGIKVGDKITTDHIMPAGQRLKYRSNIPEYAKYVFEMVDSSFSKRALDNKEKGLATVIVGGVSYGQGSSREHAAICPAYLGVKIVLAKSFERIHTANLINFGILPLIFNSESDYDSIQVGDTVVLNDCIKQVESGNTITLLINNKPVECTLLATERQRKILIAGGLLNYTTQH
ncbi:MAG TPA: aconitate hydratase [Spirochaetota bacterium]|mgnify:FL=1|nr:aconitate hydratase [Spirochaetota bacterium]